MNNAHYLAKRIEEVYLNGTWIAHTNLADALEKISYEQALQPKPKNSIAALVYHLNYYLEGFLDVLNGHELAMKDALSFNLVSPKSHNEWRTQVKKLLANARLFTDKVAAMSDEQLYAPFVKEEYGNWYRNIEGVIEHSYYHLGQMVLMSKM